MGRTVVIGDVHGCREELVALLDACTLEPEDAVVFVGDVISKGPDSHGVVELARSLKARGVRGNHDEALLCARQASRKLPTTKLLWNDLNAEQRAAAESLTEEDWAWLTDLPYYVHLPEMNAVVVHAGLAPGVPLEQQRPEHMLRMRSIRADGSVSNRIEDGVPWASLWPGPDEVVFGHDAVRGLQRYAHATGLDTGCVYGGRLTGYVLPERRLVSVPARRAWSKGGRARS